MFILSIKSSHFKSTDHGDKISILSYLLCKFKNVSQPQFLISVSSVRDLVLSSVFIVLESESSAPPQMRADVEGSTSSDSTSKKQSSVDTAEAVVDKTELELIREAAELQHLQASSLRGDQDKVSQ